MKFTRKQIKLLFYRYLEYRSRGKPVTIYERYEIPDAKTIRAWGEILDDAESKQKHEQIIVLVTSRRSFICGYIYLEHGDYYFRIINKIECYDIPLVYNDNTNEFTLRGDYYDNI